MPRPVARHRDRQGGTGPTVTRHGRALPAAADQSRAARDGGVRLGEVTTPWSTRSWPTSSTRESCHGQDLPDGDLGVMSSAVRQGAVMSNPCARWTDRVDTQEGSASLSARERVTLLQQIQDDPVARRHDLPDLVFFMLATGVRIGEAFGGDLVGRRPRRRDRRDHKHPYPRARRRAAAQGHQDPIRRTTAAAARERRSRAASTLHERGPARPAAVPRRTRRIPRPGERAPRAQGRSWGHRIGLDHLTHLPQDRATILDEAALSARLIADQLGHARPSMTQDVYLGRRAGDDQAARALDRA